MVLEATQEQIRKRQLLREWHKEVREAAIINSRQTR